MTIAEASEDVAARPDGSVGGVVLSGVVDRLPLHALLPLLAQSRRVFATRCPARRGGRTGRRRRRT